MANAPEPNEVLVKVFDTEQESEAMVVQGLLESAGIQSFITSLDIPQDVIPVGGVVVQVRAEHADEASRLIEEYRSNPGADSDEVSEAESPEPTA